MIVKFLFMVDYGVYLWYDRSIETENKVRKWRKEKMTVKEYMKKKGYTQFSITDTTLERGYVSRKKDIEIPYEDHTIYMAGGRRKGQIFIYLPCYYSSQYCHRAYLKFN